MRPHDPLYDVVIYARDTHRIGLIISRSTDWQTAETRRTRAGTRINDRYFEVAMVAGNRYRHGDVWEKESAAMALTCLECGDPLVDSTILCPRCRLKNRLIITVQLAYRKHVLDDDGIGWQELSETLQTTLAEALGDQAFQDWLATVAEQCREARP